MEGNVLVGMGSILMRRLLAIEVLGRWGLGLAEGLSALVGVVGSAGEESIPVLCLLKDVRLGGVFAVVMVLSTPVRGDENDC